jgi:negative regulator of replication initiation
MSEWDDPQDNLTDVFAEVSFIAEQGSSTVHTVREIEDRLDRLLRSEEFAERVREICRPFVLWVMVRLAVAFVVGVLVGRLLW